MGYFPVLAETHGNNHVRDQAFKRCNPRLWSHAANEHWLFKFVTIFFRVRCPPNTNNFESNGRVRLFRK